MADGAVSFAIENVSNFLVQEAKFLQGARDEVEEMQIELEWMQCFLKDAERRQGESHRVRNWVSQIREATYDVEDVIEHFALKSALRRREGVVNRIKKYVFFIKHVVELHRVGSKIKAIKSRLNKLRTRLQIYGIKELRVGGEDSGSTSWRKRQDYAHIIDHNVVGLYHKISELVTQLLDIDQEDHPVAAHRSDSVICISGMGGLGKTTLAKQVYGNRRIRAHFEGFAWVYISQQFKEREVLESILSQLSDKEKEMIQMMRNDELTSEICQVQRDKKCLVVMDDIWSNEAWAKLSVAFPYLEDCNKTKILLTTRNKDVAFHGVYHTSLDTLDATNSLELLINTIRFLGGPNHPIKDNSSLEQQAREMVRQCAGLPLAITVLGGILATKHGLKDWERVGDNMRSLINRGNGREDIGITSVLDSSYNDLPYNLKSCFLYLSQYPEDHEIHTTQLMQRWMGEGFVEGVGDRDETMEDVAEQCLNELISRCIIQVGKRSHVGRVKTCRMHDLMRDLCISKAKEENFMLVINLEYGNETMYSDTISSIGNIRRLCVYTDGNSQLPKSLSSLHCEAFPQLRSMLWIDSRNHILGLRMGLTVKNLKFSRVLVLEEVEKLGMVSSISKHIAKLIHLRYLNLRRCDIDALPSSVDKLSFLQTLDLRNCCSRLELPNSLWRMEQLRHLYLPETRFVYCESRKQQVCNFKNLQTLVNFPPLRFDLQQNLVKFTGVKKLGLFRWSLGEVGKIFPSQRLVFSCLSSLSLGLLHRYTCEEEADLTAITTGCPNLYKLCVHDQIHNMFPTTGPRCLSNLTKLVLEFSELDQSQIASLGKLRSLKILFLYYNAFIGKEMIFHENDFPQLQHLVLKRLEEMEAWTVQEGALKSIVRLVIEECKKLKYVPDRFQFLKELKEVEVRRMPYDFRKRLELGGDDWHKVRHVPSISFIDCDKEPRTESKPELEPQAKTETEKEADVEEVAEH